MIAVADPRRGAWVEVDLGAIATNVGVLAETVAPAALWVVVKADGYGHGAAAVARAALEAGAEGLCVAFVQEGAALRQSGILAPILVLSEQPEAQLDELVRWHLTATAYTPEYLDALAKEARETASPTVRVHLKVDTGMHRVGARPEQIVPLVQALLAHPELRWEGLWTHLARADEPAVPTTVLQLALLDDVVLALERAGYPPPWSTPPTPPPGWRGDRPPAGTWCEPASRSTGSRRAWSWPGCVASWSRPSRCAPG